MRGGDEPRLKGRLDPAEMFPAGRTDITVRYVLVGDVNLRIAESGDMSASPILLLHGWGASIYMWRDWFAPLAKAGRYVVAADLPGHGLSDKPASSDCYTLEAMTARVRELIAQCGWTSVTVVGQSMGGTIAFALAEDGTANVRTLVLVNPAAFGIVRNWRVFQPLSRRVLDSILPSLVSRTLVARTHRLVYGDPSRITRRDEDETWAPSQFPAYARAMRMLARKFPWARDSAESMSVRIRRLGIPLLLVLGSRDRLVRGALQYATQLKALQAQFELRVIDGGGHAVNEECPDLVLARVGEFLNG